MQMTHEGEFEVGARSIDEWWDRYQAGEFTQGYKNPSTKQAKPKVEIVEVDADELATFLTGGEKLTSPDQVTPSLLQAATNWIKNYSAEQRAKDVARDFGYLADVQDALAKWGKLTPAQAKGVLNCMRAEYARSARDAEKKAAPAAAPQTTVPDGYYGVTEDGVLKFFKVRTPDQGKWAGFTFLDIQASDDFYPIKDRVRKAAILDQIAADTMGALQAYGHGIGRCGICNRTLTDPESIEMGIGPKCAARL